MDLRDFLCAVVTCDTEGWFCLSLANKNGGGWADQWYKWPDDTDKIIEQVEKHKDNYNVYFSSYLFGVQRRTKDNVLPSRTIQVDLDEADIATLPIKPNILIETSPGRHQGFWLLSEELPLDTHEILSRKLSYAIDKADHSGWPIGHTARLPFTFNYKYPEGPKATSITESYLTPYESTQFELLPDADKPSSIEDEKWLDEPRKKLDIPVHELINTLTKNKQIPAKIETQYTTAQKDRSAALWALELALFRAGLDRDTVFIVAKQSANNKFANLRYHAERELSKDILRAQSIAQRKFPDPRTAIRDMRQMPGPKFTTNQQIANLVLEILLSEGEFVHTVSNELWYIKRETGRPVHIGKASEQLNALLYVQFGLNPAENEQVYVKHAIISYCIALPDTTIESMLAYYELSDNSLLIHSGSKDVIRITTNSTEKVYNGSNNIIFPWGNTADTFVPDFSSITEGESTYNWYDIVYGDSFKYVINMTQEQAMALMRVWTQFILFRTASYTRPILAFFGQPGGGKSTTMRRLYKVLYNHRRELLSTQTPERFDISCTKEAFFALDNADTWERWLPDRLALSIANTDVDQRKLWTDNDMITLRRQSLLGVTAHNPKFVREDVADRLLLFRFTRIPEWIDEAAIYKKIIKHRNKIWGALIHEAQAVLAQPMPSAQEAPNFRIKDFAVLGLKIAKAINVADAFREALSAVALEQRMFLLEEDSLLVNSIRNMLIKDKEKNAGLVERPAGVLWHSLEGYSGNPQAFDFMYRNAATLGKKLLVMQDSLSELFTITHRFDAAHGTRLWSFEPKNGILESFKDK